MPARFFNVHSDYTASRLDWDKFRLTYKGGREFIDKYLYQYSAREDSDDFARRRLITYCPAHAKAALNDIKNSIFQRTVDITRAGGPRSFLDAAEGIDTDGVDLLGNNMNSFIGRIILPELLSMAKVGVFVDKFDTPIKTRLDQKMNRPYVYAYRAEDILNWRYTGSRLTKIMLQDHFNENSDDGFSQPTQTRTRVCELIDGRVHVTLFDNDGNQIDLNNQPSMEPYILNLSEIPFVLFEISDSLLTDAADIQITLLNISSSDNDYALRSNFPFYVEQYSPQAEFTGGAKKDVDIGSSNGRKYPTGTERPAFINPSAEPLKVSMQKQEELRQEIRRVVNLNASNVEPKKQSAESKEYDQRGLESGLSYIGLELEFGERKIAQLWAQYEGSNEVTTIKYPEHYSLKSDAERLDEAKKLEESASMSSSITYRKAVAKEAADMRIGHRVSNDTLIKIHDEINKASIIIFDPEIMHKDIEAGLLSPETASESVRLYPKGEAEKAAEAHEERLARIAISQTMGIGAAAPDTQGNPGQENKQEKTISQKDKTREEVPGKDRTRGEGKTI